MLTQCNSGRTPAPLRAIARLMAFVCLWMGTVSVAHHTDDAYASCVSQSVSPTLSAATPAAAESPCVACEWLLSLLPRVSVDAHVSLTPAARVAFIVPLAGHTLLRSVRGVRPRGPPDFLDA